MRFSRPYLVPGTRLCLRGKGDGGWVAPWSREGMGYGCLLSSCANPCLCLLACPCILALPGFFLSRSILSEREREEEGKERGSVGRGVIIAPFSFYPKCNLYRVVYV